ENRLRTQRRSQRVHCFAQRGSRVRLVELRPEECSEQIAALPAPASAFDREIAQKRDELRLSEQSVGGLAIQSTDLDAAEQLESGLRLGHAWLSLDEVCH